MLIQILIQQQKANETEAQATESTRVEEMLPPPHEETIVSNHNESVQKIEDTLTQQHTEVEKEVSVHETSKLKGDESEEVKAVLETSHHSEGKLENLI